MREHDWKTSEGNGVRKDRRCELCEISEFSIRDSPWQVTTPCIEPVPERVSYEELVAEIRANVADERLREQLVGRVQCIGVPGQWRVGLFVGGGSVWPFRNKPFQDMEVGFARLLRYLRGRQFNPDSDSDLQYAARLAHHDCPCDDD
jgi:hypothetical protein